MKTKTRECHTCNTHKPIGDYRGTDKRAKTYHYCGECIDAELIKCNTCNIVQHKDMYSKNKGQYLDRRPKCTPCRTASITEKDLAKMKEWRANNKEHFLSKSREYYQANRERRLSQIKEWYRNNRAKGDS